MIYNPKCAGHWHKVQMHKTLKGLLLPCKPGRAPNKLVRCVCYLFKLPLAGKSLRVIATAMQERGLAISPRRQEGACAR
jgi:hypothetical protein